MSSESSGSSFGRGFLSGGYVLLGVSSGVALGYWASDWGTRFFPTVVGGILFLWMCGFALFATGAHIERTVTDVPGRRWGRRAAMFATLAAATFVSLVAVLVMGRPTPLTAMTESEFRRTHELDARYFRDLDRSLRGLVAGLESRGDLFDGENARAPSPRTTKRWCSMPGRAIWILPSRSIEFAGFTKISIVSIFREWNGFATYRRQRSRGARVGRACCRPRHVVVAISTGNLSAGVAPARDVEHERRRAHRNRGGE